MPDPRRRGRGSSLARHQVILHRGDISRLAEIYPERSASAVLREILSRHIAACLERKAEKERQTRKPPRSAQG